MLMTLMCGLAAPAAAQVPDGPVVTLVPGDKQIEVSWNDDDLRADFLRPDNYEGRYRPGTSGSWTTWRSTHTTTSKTLTGLTNGQRYQVQVRAYYASLFGDSLWSAVVTATPAAPAAPATVPAKPTGFTATPGDGQVALAWTNPNDASIALWQVRRKTTGGYGSWTTIPSSSSTTISHTVSGLTNGTAYTFQVRARNLTGNGPPSNGASATPAAVPSKPGLPTLTVGNAQLTVSWVAPAANGASISDYDVRYRAGNSGPWTEWNDTDTGTTIGATITGLTNGQSYQVQVRATNSVGNSQWSNSRSATPAAQAPSKPVVPTLAVGNAQLTVSWVAPANNGASISDYDVRYRAGNSGSWTDANYNGTGTGTTISSLANGTGYQVQVRARNSVGWGGWSDSASATPAAPATVPAKPTGFTATPGDGQVALAWTNPNDATITSWQVRRKTTGGYGSWTTIPSSSSTTISHTVSGLTNGTAYTFQVRARNLTGNGPPSDGASATPAAVPSKPGAPSLTVGNAQLEVSWVAPAANGASISDYDVRYRAGNSGPWTEWNDTDTGTTIGATITGLTNGQSYQVQVRATNSVGNSQWSNSRSATPAAQAPSKPVVPTLAVGNAQLTVSWVAPAANGASISDYDVRYRAGNSGSWTDANYNGTGTSTTISSLANGTGYQVQVRARNSVGWGGWSDSASATPAAPATVPAKPTGFTATPGDGQVALAWTNPNDASIALWQVRRKTTGGYGSWTTIPSSSSTTISHTVTGLTNGTAYTFQVRARNLTGNGPPSNGASATPAAVPSKPGLPTLTVGNAPVSWVAPAANGASISDYDVRYRAGNSGPWTEWNDTDTGTTIGATITGLTNGQSYQVQVRATNSVGNSQWSNSRSATPAAQAPSKPVAPDPRRRQRAAHGVVGRAGRQRRLNQRLRCALPGGQQRLVDGRQLQRHRHEHDHLEPRQRHGLPGAGARAQLRGLGRLVGQRQRHAGGAGNGPGQADGLPATPPATARSRCRGAPTPTTPPSATTMCAHGRATAARGRTPTTGTGTSTTTGSLANGTGYRCRCADRLRGLGRLVGQRQRHAGGADGPGSRSSPPPPATARSAAWTNPANGSTGRRRGAAATARGSTFPAAARARSRTRSAA